MPRKPDAFTNERDNISESEIELIKREASRYRGPKGEDRDENSWVATSEPNVYNPQEDPDTYICFD